MITIVGTAVWHFKKFFIEIQLIYNVVLVSGVQQSDSVYIYIHTHTHKYTHIYIYIYIYIYILF